jgi:hypothetical protein
VAHRSFTEGLAGHRGSSARAAPPANTWRIELIARAASAAAITRFTRAAAHTGVAFDPSALLIANLTCSQTGCQIRAEVGKLPEPAYNWRYKLAHYNNSGQIPEVPAYS